MSGNPVASESSRRDLRLQTTLNTLSRLAANSNLRSVYTAVRQSFSSTEQTPAVGPFRIVCASSAAVSVELDASAYGGDHIVGVGDRGGVGGRRVDHHVGDLVTTAWTGR